MSTHPFIARTEEQEKFKETLESYRTNWRQRHFPTVAKLFSSSVIGSKSIQPRIFLFYGDGGMGKTKLVERLRQIVGDSARYRRGFNTLHIDWEIEKNRPNSLLSADHSSVHPETVLSTIHNRLADEYRNQASFFGEYKKIEATLSSLERKVERELELLNSPSEDLRQNLSQLGARGITALARQFYGVDLSNPEAQRNMEYAVNFSIEIGTGIIRGVQTFLEKTLEKREYEIFVRPHEKLSEALGKGFASFSSSKPTVVMMDTYEIVDRKECDYTLRNVIKNSGDNVIWVIVGRSNIATSKRLISDNFTGYRQDFPSELVYAKRLSEFGKSEILKYFKERIPKRVINEAQAAKLGEISLGIPFVIAEAAEMWLNGVSFDEITSPISAGRLAESNPRERIIKEMTERFLRNCFVEHDIEIIYSLALLRKPSIHSYSNVELLEEMLETKRLEQELRRLLEKYSFISTEKVGLEDKFHYFLRDYMLFPLRKTNDLIQAPNQRALVLLRSKYTSILNGETDTHTKINSETNSSYILDYIHHSFWQSSYAGWKILVSSFVLFWKYNNEAAKASIEICRMFSRTFSNEPKKINLLGLLSKTLSPLSALADKQRLIEEIDGNITYDDFDESTARELKSIIFLKKGNVAHLNNNFQEAGRCFTRSSELAPQNATHLRKALADELYRLSISMTWSDSSKKSFVRRYSIEARNSIVKAIDLNPGKEAYYYCLGVILEMKGDFSGSMEALKKAIEINRNYANPYNLIGSIYRKKSKYEEAERYFRRAIDLDNDFASPHIHLGYLLEILGKSKEARNVLEKGLLLCDSKQKAKTYYILGNIHRNRSELLAAEDAYKKAIDLDEKYAVTHNALGWIYVLRKEYGSAKIKFEKAISLDPDEASFYFNSGIAVAMQGDLVRAREQWKQGLSFYDGSYAWEEVMIAFYEVVLGDTRAGINKLQRFLNEGKEIGGLKNAYGDAKILAECPVKINGMDRVVSLLENFLRESS